MAAEKESELKVDAGSRDTLYTGLAFCDGEERVAEKRWSKRVLVDVAMLRNQIRITNLITPENIVEYGSTSYPPQP
ncbi:hypothetical protein HRE53_00535 [Acaryochloris sp. 'Moss Beach']|uniref:hypothetical protein n=1 Tax=Acaryochloris sp. 'Moss Beach' TaxID=2740837 RepID=UPI001F3B17C3|nr:hypothetical protein [Acaryochloris sp. 'Moss Beach']UJB69752.1 hypothetical protein HRE53_00535 [Acaryochloris sp. 'Moss Beach']